MMGRQIALNTAKYDVQVCVTDSNTEVCEQARAWTDEYLAERMSKGHYGRKNGHSFYDYEQKRKSV